IQAMGEILEEEAPPGGSDHGESDFVMPSNLGAEWRGGTRRQVVLDESTIYTFASGGGSAGDPGYRKSTDGGATWAAKVSVGSGNNISTNADIYYERWNDLDNDPIVHLFDYQDGGDRGIYHRKLDLSDDSLSTRTLTTESGSNG